MFKWGYLVSFRNINNLFDDYEVIKNFMCCDEHED